MVIDGKTTICKKFSRKKRERFEGKERKIREERDERFGARRPRFYFSRRPGHVGAQGVALERGQVPDPSFRYSGSALECKGKI